MAPSNLLFFLLLATATPLITGQPFDYPTANVSMLWINNNASLVHGITYTDGSVVRAILLRSPKTLFGPSFAAGFFCPSAPCDTGSFLFAVFIVYTNSGARITMPVAGVPQVVWSANRFHPVKENATLALTGDGNLILRDADGSHVWSSSTAGRSIAHMVITELGNLVLVDQKNATVWQSFEHPTDALVPGQSLLEGMRLTANTSATNWTQNQLYMTVFPNGLYAYVESTPPQPYFSQFVSKNKTGNFPTLVTFTNGSLSIFAESTQPNPDSGFILPAAKSTQYLRFESDGHLRLYEWSQSDTEAKWAMVFDVIKMFPDNCAFPTVCGEYGVCTGGQCSCPFQSNSTSSYFKPIDGWKANVGCVPLTPISCQEMQHHELMTLTDVSYFDTSHTIINARNRDTCKQACLKNCSCKAVMFRYGNNESDGDCQWVTKVFSMQSIQPQIVHYNSSAYLKVQLSSSPSASTANTKKVIIGTTIASIAAIVLIAGAVTLYV
ncbi:unnamed protein product [Urochloa humidicola]